MPGPVFGSVDRRGGGDGPRGRRAGWNISRLQTPLQASTNRYQVSTLKTTGLGSALIKRALAGGVGAAGVEQCDRRRRGGAAAEGGDAVVQVVMAC